MICVKLSGEKKSNKRAWDDFDPFTIPINVKIADLGNACWTVSKLRFEQNLFWQFIFEWPSYHSFLYL